jgi:hypothetical protein
VNPGENYDPLMISLVKSTSISVDEGKRQVEEGFLSLETIETHTAIQRVNGARQNISVPLNRVW